MPYHRLSCVQRVIPLPVFRVFPVILFGVPIPAPAIAKAERTRNQVYVDRQARHAQRSGRRSNRFEGHRRTSHTESRAWQAFALWFGRDDARKGVRGVLRGSTVAAKYRNPDNPSETCRTRIEAAGGPLPPSSQGRSLKTFVRSSFGANCLF